MDDDEGEELHRLELENINIRHKYEMLEEDLEDTNSKLANSERMRAELNEEKLQIEEEKLRVSKDLVEMELEHNKAREEFQAVRYDMTNRVVMLEHELVEMQTDRDKAVNELMQLRERTKDLEARLADEQDEKDQIIQDEQRLSDAYHQLKDDYTTLSGEYENEVSRNDQLSREMLNLANSKAVMAKQLVNLDLLDGNTAHNDLERTKQLISDLSHRSLRPEDVVASDKQRELLEKSIVGKKQRYTEQISSMRIQHQTQIRDLKESIDRLMNEIEENRTLLRDYQRKLGETSAQLVTCKSDRDELKQQNNRLQHKLKDVMREYRERLVKYVKDIAAFMDSAAKGKEKSVNEMSTYVKNMLEDYRRAHKAREEQISEAAKDYKQQLESTVKKYEEVLAAHRNLRDFVGDEVGRSSPKLNPRLDLADTAPAVKTQRDIRKLTEEVSRLKRGIEDAKMGISSDIGSPRMGKEYQAGTANVSWMDLKDKSNPDAQDLSEERERLQAKCEMLENQLSDSQRYIDRHIGKYRTPTSMSNPPDDPRASKRTL